MTRQEFLDALERELSALPRDERASALRYYSDYFDDAGDDERAVIAELGTPQALAADIVREYKPRTAVDGTVPPPPRIDTLPDGEQAKANADSAVTDNPVDDTAAPVGMPYPVPDTEIPVNIVRANAPRQDNAQTDGTPHDSAQTRDTSTDETGFRPNNMRQPNYSTGVIIAIVCSAPLWIPLLLGLLAGVFGLAIALVAMLFAFAICGVAVLVAGGALLAAGILELSVAVPSGILAIGAGLAMAGIGLLLIALMVNVLVRAIPAIFRGVGHLFSSISNKLRRQA